MRAQAGHKLPTLQDVADHAGVSLATASRALKGDHPMSTGTRERVLASVETVGYRRIRAGRHEEPLVAVVASTLGHMVIASVVAGVEDASAEAGRTCTISVTKGDLDREIAILQSHAEDARIGAVIVIGGLSPNDRWRRALTGVALRLQDRQVPLLFCGRSLEGLGLPGLTVLDYDSAGGAEAALGVLVGRGHRAIGVIRGRHGFSTSDARQRGCLQAFADHGLELTDDLVVEGKLGPAAGEEGVITLLRRRPDITAIFAESDTVAIGAIRGARRLQLELPRDLSIIGFDDMRHVDALAPALTTVHMPFAELGRRAARMALGEEPGESLPPEVIFGTHVVMRESVGPPRQAPLQLPPCP